eukprot:894598-Amorphochlora_amoeboformis.AAC.2
MELCLSAVSAGMADRLDFYWMVGSRQNVGSGYDREEMKINAFLLRVGGKGLSVGVRVLTKQSRGGWTAKFELYLRFLANWLVIWGILTPELVGSLG